MPAAIKVLRQENVDEINRALTEAHLQVVIGGIVEKLLVKCDWHAVRHKIS